MDLERKQEEASRSSTFQAVSDLLEWLAKVWAPLGAFIIAIAAIYWLEFIRVYAIPVSFASSSALTGLPAIAAALTAMVGVLAIFVLMPAGLLWLSVDRQGNTLMDGHRDWQSEHPPMVTGVRRLREWGLLGRWITAQMALGLLWAAVIAAAVVAQDVNIGVFTIPATVVAIAGYWCLLRPIRKRICGKPTIEFCMMFFVLTGTQFLLAFSVIYVALQTAPDSSGLTLSLRAIACLSVMAALSVAQLVAAKLVSNGWYPNAPKHIVLALLVLTALPTTWPPIGGAMTAFLLRTSASDGRFCVVMLAPDIATAKNWRTVWDSSKPDQSLPLDFAVRLDDTYYVKQTKASPTQPIPVGQTRGIASCPSIQANRPAPAAHPAESQPMLNASIWTTPSLLIATGSMLVALCSLLFSVRSWRQTNRPLVVSRIATHASGNIGISLNLTIENAGNRPALDVRLHAREADVRQAMIDASPNAGVPIDATRVFFSDVFVPVLSGGTSVLNAFGSLGVEGTWRAGATIPITITYRGLGGPCYRESMTLLLASDEGFAQTVWKKTEE